MDYLLYMLATVVIGMAILVVYIMMNREPGQSLKGLLIECVAWGVGGFISFAAEILVIWRLVW